MTPAWYGRKNLGGWVGRWPHSFYGLKHLYHFKAEVLLRDQQRTPPPLNTCPYLSSTKHLATVLTIQPFSDKCPKRGVFFMASLIKFLKNPVQLQFNLTLCLTQKWPKVSYFSWLLSAYLLLLCSWFLLLECYYFLFFHNTSLWSPEYFPVVPMLFPCSSPT